MELLGGGGEFKKGICREIFQALREGPSGALKTLFSASLPGGVKGVSLLHSLIVTMLPCSKQ